MTKSICANRKFNDGLYTDVYNAFDNSIAILKLPKPALRALYSVNLFSIERVRDYGEERVRALHGMGEASIKKLFP